MRSFSIHPVSLALGLVLGGIAFLSMSQAIVVTTPLRIEYAPHPRDLVQISEGTSFTVPAGRILVITGLGQTAHTASQADIARLSINGSVELEAANHEACTCASGVDYDTPTVKPAPVGLTASAGSTVSVSTILGSNNGRAWGYLAIQ